MTTGRGGERPTVACAERPLPLSLCDGHVHPLYTRPSLALFFSLLSSLLSFPLLCTLHLSQ